MKRACERRASNILLKEYKKKNPKQNMWTLVEWTEENLFSIISLKPIEAPRRDYEDYKENDLVYARFGGKVYPARIIQKSKSKVDLDEKMRELGSTIGKNKILVVLPPIQSDIEGVVGAAGASAVEPATQIQPVFTTETPKASAGTVDISEHGADDVPDYFNEKTARPQTDVQRSDRKLKELEDEVGQLRKKVRKLEDRISKIEQSSSNDKESSDPNKEPNELECLKSEVDNLQSSSETKIIKVLALKAFSTNELVNMSLSGKKSIKSGDTARPLNQTKLAMLEQVFRYKCPISSRKTFVEKFQNIQKVLRRESKKGE